MGYQSQVNDDREDLEEDLFQEGVYCSAFAESAEDFSCFLVNVEIERESMDMFERPSREFAVRVLRLDRAIYGKTCPIGIHRYERMAPTMPIFPCMNRRKT